MLPFSSGLGFPLLQDDRCIIGHQTWGFHIHKFKEMWIKNIQEKNWIFLKGPGYL
jgi:hypothetical protein